LDLKNADVIAGLARIHVSDSYHDRNT